MNEDSSRIPFFLNTKRLQRDDTYWDIGRTQERLRKFLEDRRNANAITSEEDWREEYGTVGIYGVSRYIKFEEDEDEKIKAEAAQEADIDEQFDKTSAFKLFWMTFKRIATSLTERFLTPKTPPQSACQQDDVRSSTNHNCNMEENNEEDLCNIIVEPSNPALNDRRVKDDLIVYGDVNYLVQKFRMELKCGSVDVALFSVELPRTGSKTSGGSTDLQAFVVSPECGSYVWIEDGRASAIFMTRSSQDFFGSIMEWFRKILSDMVLADSVMIGHPYYWQPQVRRRLNRVMKYLKRLYRTLALKERNRQEALQSGVRRIEVLCPSEISKIVINEQPSRNLTHVNSTYDKLNIMLEQLVKKWFDYNQNFQLCEVDNVQDIFKTYTFLNPEHTPSEDGILESVTFLDFFPHTRHYAPVAQSPSIPTTSMNQNPTRSISLNSTPHPQENSDEEASSTSGLPDFNENFLNPHAYPNGQVRQIYHLEDSKCEEADSEESFC